MTDRRAFVRSAAALLAAAPLAPPFLRRRQESAFRWHRLRDDAWMVEKGGGNTTVIRERDGAVVIDLKLGGVGAGLRREIEARVGPIQAVIITHHHGDHAGGYHAFRPIRGFMHRNAAPRLRTNLVATGKAAAVDRDQFVDQTFEALDRDFEFARTPASEADVRGFVAWAIAAGPDDGTPTDLVEDRSEPSLGRATFRLIHSPTAHTDNDLFVVDRRRRLVITGDLLFHHYHPFVDIDAGATIGGWQKAIDAMVAEMKSDWTVVPGHGAATDRDGLIGQRTYFETVRSLVLEAGKAGKSREEIVALPNRYPNYGFGTAWSANLGIAYDEERRGSEPGGARGQV